MIFFPFYSGSGNALEKKGNLECFSEVIEKLNYPLLEFIRCYYGILNVGFEKMLGVLVLQGTIFH